MTLIFLLDDTTSDRKWLRYTRYVILYIKSCDPYFITSLQFMVHKLYFLPFRITRFNPQFLLRFESIFCFLCNVCRSLFVFLLFFNWPLYCLSFDLRILITSLISLNFSSIQSIFSQSFDFEHTFGRLFKRRVVHT